VASTAILINPVRVIRLEAAAFDGRHAGVAVSWRATESTETSAKNSGIV
jgi:hypothetical protein